MKYFGGSGASWESMAKRRVMIAGCTLAVGGLSLVLLGTVVPGSDLPELVRHIYFGAGGGLIGASAAQLAYSLWLYYHPEKAKEQFVRENDEREKLAGEKAAKWGFWALFWGLVPAMMVAAPLNLTVFWTLLGVYACLCVALVAGLVLAQRLL